MATRIRMGFPNWLTLTRVLLIPVLVLVFLLPFNWASPAAAGVFMIAGLTDWLDGFIARWLNEGSRLGAFLDPLADKLLVATALVLIVMAGPHIWVVIPAMIIIGREIAISALREWMAEAGAARRVAVSWVGKIKTAVQMAAIVLMLFQHPVRGIHLYWIGLALLYLAVGLTLWSMSLYLRAAWPWFGGFQERAARRDTNEL